ncbi:transposase, partial [Selenomonas sp. KH1T6]|uniref:transposase n=1 Tax=Selenomonas sp. KH1T6 TaxID=3158784 RepID=UPI0008A7F41D
DVEIVWDMLDDAYIQRDENAMREVVERMSNYCKHTRNSHFLWFAKLLDSHIEGIISHASIPIASGKMEGINNKIKTLRRMCYGLPDDEYFFLKLLDMSRNGQRNILRASSVRY